MAAAVSDYRPADRAGHKVKKGPDRKTIGLEKNADFLLEVPDSVVKIGFAAETRDLDTNAKAKLAEKRLDLIVANDVTAPGAGFAHDTNVVTLIDRSGGSEALPLMSKYDVGQRILDRLVALLRNKG